MHVKVDKFDDYNLVVACNIASTLSIIGCTCIILIFLRFQRLRKHFARLVVYLTISDLWFCFSNILGHFPDNGSGCFVQALLSTYFGLSSILWTGSIAYSLRRVIENTASFNEALIEVRMLQICWGIPFLLTVATLIFVRFEPAGYWCWIEGTAMGEMTRLIVFYIPLWSCICYCTFTYRRLSKRVVYLLNTQDPSSRFVTEMETSKQEENRALQRLMMFPMVLVFCWSSGSISRIIGIFFPKFSWSLLNYITVFTGSLQGFLNAVLYGSTIAVREAIVDSLDDGVRLLRQGVHTWKNRKEKRMERLGYKRTAKRDGSVQFQSFENIIGNQQDEGLSSIGNNLISYDLEPLEDIMLNDIDDLPKPKEKGKAVFI